MVNATKGYGQYCPLAKAAEVVAERWTPLVIRELIAGSHHFNDLRKGVPRMSPSLLSKRLTELEDAGVIVRTRQPGKKGFAYHLTAAGRDLAPILEALGRWGQKYVQHEIERDDLDPDLLMWDLRRSVDRAAVPAGKRLTVQFDVSGVPSKKSRWWLVFDRGEVDLCLTPPGYEVDLFVASSIKSLTHVWMGLTPLPAALRSADVRLSGAREAVRGFRKWFKLNAYARERARAAVSI